MIEWVLLYYVHKNIPMVPFLYIIRFILTFQIILNKNFKTTARKFKLKIKWTTFCGIHTKIPLVANGKCPKGGHCNVLSSSKHKYSHFIHTQVAHTCICVKKLYDKIGEPFQGLFFQCFDVTKLLIIHKII